MIYIDSCRKKEDTLRKLYPDAVLIDVTSHATDQWQQLSPFYPHYNIPVPFSPGVNAACVEGVWQGLKVFEHEDIDLSCFTNGTMHNLKRTVATHGPCIGHRKGVQGTQLLDYVEARKQIFIPTYGWMLQYKAADLIKQLRKLSATQTVVLLDFNTNADIEDTSKPLSHASLVKAYAEGLYPYGTTTPKTIQQLTLF